MIRKGEIEMDEIQLFPQEASEAGEASEQVENHSLNDATFEPRAYVEQAGDYRQAEAVQNSFTAVVDSVLSQTNEASGVSPLPATAGETGFKEQVGDCPIPIPRPVEEIGQKNSLTGTIEVAETPLPAPAGEIGFKEVAAPFIPGGAETPLPSTTGETGQKVLDGELRTPIPPPSREAGEVGRNEIESAAIDHMVNTVQAPAEMDQGFNLQYLMLQNKISQENRQFSMVSNIIKDKHDTAKNAINNIR
jgi:hypothetical protein